MIQFQCCCGKVLTVRPEFESRKLQCPACESLIRIRRSEQSSQTASGGKADSPTDKKRRKKSKTSSAKAVERERRRKPARLPDDIEDLDEAELIDDDFDELDDFAFADEPDDDEFKIIAAPELPQAKKRKRPVRQKSKAKKKATSDSDSSGSGLPPKVLIPLFCIAGLVLVGIVALVLSSITSSSEAYARSQAVPETFSKWTHDKGILSSEYPNGFQVSSGVAAGGVAPWAKFELEEQDIVIMVRASMSGSAISDILGAQGGDVGTAEELAALEIQRVNEVHQLQFEKMQAEYDSYEEEGKRMVDCKLGKGCISEFHGSKLFLKSQGLRATLLGSQFQYNVICKCPADRIEDYTPVFERVIKSVGG